MGILHKSFGHHAFRATYQVHWPQNNMRLDRFLQNFTGPGLSRQAIQAKIRDGAVNIQGRRAKVRPSTCVKEGQVIDFTIRRTTHEDEYWNHQRQPLEKASILYQDDDLVALAKPPYMATHPTGRHLFNCATVFLQNCTGRAVHSLHRLDRETSGLLLLAKNSRAAQNITPLFEQGKVKKAYFFIAVNKAGLVGNEQFSARQRLGSEGKTLSGRVCVCAYPSDSPWGQSAHTDFKILWKIRGKHKTGISTHASKKNCDKSRVTVHNLGQIGGKQDRATEVCSLHIARSDGEADSQDGLKCEQLRTSYLLGLAFPHTGRQHQIRVHAKALGLPLLGDKLYCGSYALFQRFKDLRATTRDHQLMQIPYHALHALAANLPYPPDSTLNVRRTFWCPLTRGLKEWMEDNLELPLSLPNIEDKLRKEVHQSFSTGTPL